MSIYRNGDKILNSITVVDEEKVKEIVASEMTDKGVCTTKVADVTKTKVPFVNYFSGLSCYYEINNGICTVYFIGGALSLSSNVDGGIVGTLPKPKNIVYKSVCTWTSGAPVLFMVNTDGTLIVHAGTNVNGSSMYDTFSYPVAES